MGQGKEKLCRDRVGPSKRNHVATKYFHVATELGEGQEFLCRDRVFPCRDKVWPIQEILGHNRVFSCPDRVWSKGQESSCRDSVALICVVIEEAMRA